MNPDKQFCPNPDCVARGQVGAGNIGLHSHTERRYVCHRCGRTFSDSKGTAWYRLKKVEWFVMVMKLLAHGCPLQAIGAAFDLDERTVADWLRRGGQHCQAVHEQVVGRSQQDLQQVQADELKVKTQGGIIWMASAIRVVSRLWLGGVISPSRDRGLIRALVAPVRQVALCRPLLLAVDGLSSSVQAFQAALRSPLPRGGQAGRPRLVAWPNIAIVQVVKRHTSGVGDIQRRIVQGCPRLIERLLQATQGGGVINTAFIERLNATFRQRLAWLVRRSRALARSPRTLEAAMYLLGCVYNFCSYHRSLALPLYITKRRRRWLRRTPAIAAGLTDHRWSVEELLAFKCPLSPYVAPKKRGRSCTVRLGAVT
jgi:transposase-like protein